MVVVVVVLLVVVVVDVVVVVVEVVVVEVVVVVGVLVVVDVVAVSAEVGFVGAGEAMLVAVDDGATVVGEGDGVGVAGPTLPDVDDGGAGAASTCGAEESGRVGRTEIDVCVVPSTAATIVDRAALSGATSAGATDCDGSSLVVVGVSDVAGGAPSDRFGVPIDRFGSRTVVVVEG